MARQPLGRQPLLEAARAEFLERQGTFDLAGVARRADLSVGALYHHFGSKVGLLAALYDAFYQGLIDAIRDDTLPANDEWGRRERARTRNFVRYHFAEPLAPLLLNGASPDPEIAAVEAGYLHRITQASSRNLAEAQAHGQIDPRLDIPSAAAYLIGGLRHGIAQQLRCDPQPSPDEATAKLWSLIAATLGLT